MSKEIKQLVAEKRRHFHDCKLTQGADSFMSFKKYPSLVNRKLREALNQIPEVFLKKIWNLKREMEINYKKVGKK